MSRPQKQTGQRRKVSKKLAPAKTLSGISAFQDERGRVAIWPSARRRKSQLAVLEHLADFFEAGHIYSESEVGTILQTRSSLDDVSLLRGELVDAEYLAHDEAAKVYWRSVGRPTASAVSEPETQVESSNG